MASKKTANDRNEGDNELLPLGARFSRKAKHSKGHRLSENDPWGHALLLRGIALTLANVPKDTHEWPLVQYQAVEYFRLLLPCLHSFCSASITAKFRLKWSSCPFI